MLFSSPGVGVRLFVTLMAYVISMLVHETTYQDAPQSPYTMVSFVTTIKSTKTHFAFAMFIQNGCLYVLYTVVCKR